MPCFILILFVQILLKTEAAKILAVFSAPSISHQVVFRPYTQELARRGHEVTVVTTDPDFPNGTNTKNLIEIDIHDMLYTVLKTNYSEFKVAEKFTMYSHFNGIFGLINKIGETFFNSEIIGKLVERNFDLLIIEAFHKIVLPLPHILQVPVMQISSFSSMFDYETVGAPCHPAFYPEITSQRVNNLTQLEMLYETFLNLIVKRSMYAYEDKYVQVIRKLDPNMPSLYDLRNRVSAMLLNVEPVWEENRAVPLGVAYISGLHRWPAGNMSQELKDFLDSSTNGVIYVSFGTNIHPSLLPKDKIQVILNTFGRLPQNILLKWDNDDLPGKPKNIMISKWFPQTAILDHPNVKLFITQCGLQSTEEAINAGIPLLGIPLIFDQWTNAARYVRHKIGLKLEMETLTEDQLEQAVATIIGNISFRENILRLRTLMRDQPHSALETAVWWTEYVARYAGAHHLRSPAANMPLTQYLELELLCMLLTACLILLYIIYMPTAYIIRRFIFFLRMTFKNIRNVNLKNETKKILN